MKNLFYFLTLASLLISCVSQNAEKKEITFINNAVNKAKADNKILIIEFWAPECSSCIKMKHEIFENEKTSEFLNKNFVVVPVSPADSIYKSLWKHFNLVYTSSIIFMDKNGNEIDRTISYDGNRDAYLSFLKDVSEGRNLYSEALSTYKKDTMDVSASILMAKKLFFRYQLKEAIKQYNKVLLLDQENTKGFNPECKFKIAECDFMLTGKLEKMWEYIKSDSKNIYMPKAYEYLIQDLINKNDKKSCIPLCMEAFNKYPDSWEILNKYAWAICVFKIPEEYNKAITMVQKSISLNPYRSGTYTTEAWLHFEMGNKEKAIELEKKAIEIYPHPSYIQDLEKFKSM
jgi:thioredoxin-related protein